MRDFCCDLIAFENLFASSTREGSSNGLVNNPKIWRLESFNCRPFIAVSLYNLIEISWFMYLLFEMVKYVNQVTLGWYQSVRIKW